MKKAILTLDDGAAFEGFLEGATEMGASGMVVFNTSMAGYPELLTDPASAGKIVVMTYPLIGNYGVSGVGLESAKVQAAALVVTDLSPEPSHWNAKMSLGKWLAEQGVPILTGVDTRALAKHLRDHGAQGGRIEGEISEHKWTPVVETRGSGAKKITLVDCGVAESLVEALAKDATVSRVSPDHDFAGDGADLIVVAGNAGDPHDYKKTIENLRGSLNNNTPLMGIGHGHLLIALAAGAKLERLKFGHHGSNQPVQKTGTNTVFITRQNHLWAVDVKTLPADWELTHENLNDRSNEGMKHRSKPFTSTQFTPEI